MKKKILVIFSLLLCCVMLGACTGNVMIVKKSYDEGIANFYQYFLTGFYNGINVQNEELEHIQYTDETKIDEACLNATALLQNQQYVMSSIHTFLSESVFEDYYSYNINGKTESFSILKNSVPYQIQGVSYSEFQVLNGFESITSIYVRQNANKFNVALPTSAQGEYKYYVVEYSDGYLAISATESGVTYKNEIIFDASGVIYVTFNAGEELHYELILGSQSAEMRYTVNFAKSGEISNTLASNNLTRKNFAKEDNYSNAVCGYVNFDGLSYNDNLENFDLVMKNNQGYKVKYETFLSVIDSLRV